MHSEPTVRRGNAPQRAAMVGFSALEATNNTSSASSTRQSHQYPAEGAGAPFPQVIRQPR